MSRKYYLICDDDCRFEGMTKEQILAAIAEATGVTPTGVDDGFITKIKESNKNANLSFWLGTETEFNSLGVNATPRYVRVDSNGKVYLSTNSGWNESAIKANPILYGTEWRDNSQTVEVTGVTPTNVVIISPNEEETHYRAFIENGIRCIAQGTNSLTFYSESPPESDVKVNVLIPV